MGQNCGGIEFQDRHSAERKSASANLDSAANRSINVCIDG
jgi:hypothetical protein